MGEKSITAQERLNAMLPSALDVIEQTILGTGDWEKDSISCSQWVIEKLTGKATPQEAETGVGLIKQLLLQIQEDRKAALALDLEVIKKQRIAKKDLNEIDEFAKHFDPLATE